MSAKRSAGLHVDRDPDCRRHHGSLGGDHHPAVFFVGRRRQGRAHCSSICTRCARRSSFTSSHHDGAVPALTSGSLPQLTSATDLNGNIGAAGPSFPFGPYMQSHMPTNPFDGHNTVIATAVFPPTATTTDGGWLYNAATGQIAPNTAGHLND